MNIDVINDSVVADKYRVIVYTAEGRQEPVGVTVSEKRADDSTVNSFEYPDKAWDTLKQAQRSVGRERIFLNLKHALVLPTAGLLALTAGSMPLLAEYAAKSPNFTNRVYFNTETILASVGLIVGSLAVGLFYHKDTQNRLDINSFVRSSLRSIPFNRK